MPNHGVIVRAHYFVDLTNLSRTVTVLCVLLLVVNALIDALVDARSGGVSVVFLS